MANSSKKTNKTNTTKKTATNKTFTETVKPTDTTQTVKDYAELASNFNNTVTQKVNAAKEKGKNTYTGYDKNGVLHYTTMGQDRMNAILDYYNNTENPSYSMGGVNYVIDENKKDAYEQQLEQLQEWYQQQIASINANTQASVDAINAGKSTVESNYEDTMREAYISQQKNKLANSEQLNAMGYSGGVAESTLADIDNTYQNNRLAGYKVRQNALSEIDSQAAEAKNSGNTSLANLSTDYYDKYLNILSDQQAYKEQQEAAAQEQANVDREYKYQKEQDALAQSNYEQEQKEERYAASVAGRYTTVEGAQAAIKSIQKSGKNTWKIPYIYARIAEIREAEEEAKKKVANSSGSSRKSSGNRSSKSSGYYSSKNSSGSSNEIEKAAKAYVKKNPKVATNSATVDTYLASSNYSASEKEAFKYYMQQAGAPYITRG